MNSDRKILLSSRWVAVTSEDMMAKSKIFDFLPYKPGAPHPVASAPLKAQMCFCLFGLWPKIQATRSAGGR